MNCGCLFPLRSKTAPEGVIGNRMDASASISLKKVTPKAFFQSGELLQGERGELMSVVPAPAENEEISTRIFAGGSRNMLVSDHLFPHDDGQRFMFAAEEELTSPRGRVEEDEEKADILMPLQAVNNANTHSTANMLNAPRGNSPDPNEPPAAAAQQGSSSSSAPLSRPDSHSSMLSSMVSNIRGVLSRSVFSSQKSNIARSVPSSGAYNSSGRHPEIGSPSLSRNTSFRRGASSSRKLSGAPRGMTFLEELEIRSRFLASVSLIGGKSGERLRYLVVDHSIVTRKEAVKLIAGQGQHVVPAVEGLDCLRIVEDAKNSQQPFDVILVDDDNMPMTLPANEICRLLRSRGYEAVLIIALCNTIDPLNAKALFASGFDAVIQRPLNVSNLQEELRALLEHKASAAIAAAIAAANTPPQQLIAVTPEPMKHASFSTPS